MKIAIVTLEAFNELDSFVASAILNRVPHDDWTVQICCPTDSVTSMNGVRISAQQPIEYANDGKFLARFALDESRQLIGAQCSGALFLHRLGLATGTLSTDTMTAPHLSKEGVTISDRPLHVQGNIASAGGCLASHYLAAWVIAMKTNWQTAADIIHYVAPVGQKDDFVNRAHAVVVPMLP